jgi:hypothetical protein
MTNEQQERLIESLLSALPESEADVIRREYRAIGICHAVLAPLTDESRRRVLAWAGTRFGR